jgi:predicted MPP superfamily phosphohydrolase
MMQNKVNLLHISDLHFRDFLFISEREDENTENKMAQLAIEEFDKKLSQLNKTDKIDAILLTGDIFNGGQFEYTDKNIELFFKTLKKISNNIFLAYGNHELKFFLAKNEKDLTPNNEAYKDDILELEKVLKYKNLKSNDFQSIKERLHPIFSSQMDTDFFKKLEDIMFVDPLEKHDFKQNYYSLLNENFRTFGINTTLHPNIIIVSINSAWLNFSSSQSKNNLIAGHCIIKEIDLELQKINPDKKKLVITLIHNDYNWFDYSERYSDNQANASTIAYINNFSNIILCGHEHGEVPPAFIDFESYIFKVGGLFKGSEFSFSIFKVNFLSNILTRNCYYWDKITNKWLPKEIFNLNCELFSSKSVKLFKDPVRSVDDLYEINKNYEFGFCHFNPKLKSSEFENFRDFIYAKQQKLRDKVKKYKGKR